MADDRAVAVPLVEQLRSVPRDAVLRIDTPNALGCMDTRSIPVGRMCSEAADALGVAPCEPPDLSEILSGETLTQREEVCEAWHALPDELRKDQPLTRLYHALGGPRMDDPGEAPSGVAPCQIPCGRPSKGLCSGGPECWCIHGVAPTGEGLEYEGSAFVDGDWQPWHDITREVYENRQKWPREGYRVRVCPYGVAPCDGGKTNG